MPWFCSSPARIRVCAAFIGFCVFAAAFAVDWLMYARGSNPIFMMLASTGLAGLISALLCIRALDEWYRRRIATEEYLRLVSEMNHHIRNALDVIQMSAALTSQGDAIQAIDASVIKIDWALRELLGSPLLSKKPADSGIADSPREQHRA